MFSKKQYIFSETLGVCQVENITQLNAGKGDPVSYYVLRPVFSKEQTSYIPVENHEMVLTELFSKEEALRLQQEEEQKLKENPLLKDAVEFVLAQ